MKQLKWALVPTTLLFLFCFFFVDQKVAIFFKSSTPNDIHQFFKSFTDLALAAPYYIIAISGILVTKSMENSRPQLSAWKYRFQFLFYSLLSGGLSVTLFKSIIGRRRPYDAIGYQPDVFDPFTTDWNYHSLPSGHTQVAFCVATVATLCFPKFRIYFFLLALLLGFSRILLTDHFVSDTIMGAVFGITATMFIYRYMRTKSLLEH